MAKHHTESMGNTILGCVIHWDIHVTKQSIAETLRWLLLGACAFCLTWGYVYTISKNSSIFSFSQRAYRNPVIWEKISCIWCLTLLQNTNPNKYCIKIESAWVEFKLLRHRECLYSNYVISLNQITAMIPQRMKQKTSLSLEAVTSMVLMKAIIWWWRGRVSGTTGNFCSVLSIFLCNILRTNILKH